MNSSRKSAVALTAVAATLLLAGCDDPGPTTVQVLEPPAQAHTPDAGIIRTPFAGLYFPAGMAGTQSECPYAWEPPSFCIMEPGTQTELPNGHVRFRDIQLYELAFAWREDGQVEPRKTGYDIIMANANFDTSLSGPTWGTWELHDFEGEVIFTGFFTGAFVEGIPAVRFSGKGVGAYEGQKMRGEVERTFDEDGHNMHGVILESARD